VDLPERLPSGGAVWSGPAIVDDVVYWGSGYDTRVREMPYDGNNNKFYAFSLDGRWPCGNHASDQGSPRRSFCSLPPAPICGDEG